jgi:serine/threonine-protein kinase RsbW
MMIPSRYRTRAHATASVVAEARSGAVAHARSVGAGRDVCEAVRLAVSEAVTNVVMHAYQGMEQGDVLVEAWTTDDGHLCVRVLDEGRGLIPRADSPGLGIGFGVMAQMADDFRVSNRDHPGTVVSLRFSLAGAHRPDEGQPSADHDPATPP